MKKQFALLLWCFMGATNLHGQISPELQKAIESVPFARFNYPADRDRDMPPQVPNPVAFAYAYYHLPYAIDLHINYDPMSGLYIEKVMLDYPSARLTAGAEKQILSNALSELKALLGRQYINARQAGFYAHYQSFSPSLIAALAADGDVIIAIREIISTQDLIHKLTVREASLQE